MAVYKERTLLTKYNLTIDQLDYAFINKCKNVQTLERVLKVLRSGEEGMFPDLMKFCENKLRELAPNSKLLIQVKHLSTYSDLPINKKQEIEEEIKEWLSDYYNDGNRMNIKEKENILPPVRGKSLSFKNSKVNNSNNLVQQKKGNRPRSYSEWDKFNVDEELQKIDKEESTNNKIASNPEKEIPSSGLSDKECQYIANLEKNKGNEAFKAGDYSEAIIFYTRSLSVFKTTTVLNNRAQAYIKVKNYLAATCDCTEVINIEPNNMKALHRRGIAYKEGGLLDLAKLDFKTILELDSENKLAKAQLKQIKELKMKSRKQKQKITIQEIGSDEYIKGNSDEHTDSDDCKRIHIEEVTENTEKIMTLSLNDSDSDDESYQILPQKVKNMLKLNESNKKQIYKKSNMINIENIDAKEMQKTATKRNKKDLERKSNHIIRRFEDDYFDIKIQNLSHDNEEKSKNSLKSEANIEVETKFKTDNCVNNTECTEGTTLIQDYSDKFNNSEYNKNKKQCNISQNNIDANEHQNSKEIKTSFLKDPEENMEAIGSFKESVTPYEFLQMWYSKNAMEDSVVAAKYLLTVKPENLPNILTNKLDGSLLFGLLKGIYKIFEIGIQEEAEKYLNFLSRVERINIASMLLSSNEVEEILSLFAKLEDTGQKTTIRRILQ